VQCWVKNVIRGASAQLLFTLSLCKAVHMAASEVNVMSPVAHPVSLNESLPRSSFGERCRPGGSLFQFNTQSPAAAVVPPLPHL